MYTWDSLLVGLRFVEDLDLSFKRQFDYVCLYVNHTL